MKFLALVLICSTSLTQGMHAPAQHYPSALSEERIALSQELSFVIQRLKETNKTAASIEIGDLLTPKEIQAAESFLLARLGRLRVILRKATHSDFGDDEIKKALTAYHKENKRLVKKRLIAAKKTKTSALPTLTEANEEDEELSKVEASRSQSVPVDHTIKPSPQRSVSAPSTIRPSSLYTSPLLPINEESDEETKTLTPHDSALHLLFGE